MSVQTAGKLKDGGQESPPHRSGSLAPWRLPRRWLLALGGLFIFLLLMTALASALARSRETLTMRSVAEADAISFAKDLQSRIDQRLREFRRLKWNALSGSFASREELKKDAIEFQRKHSDFCVEIGEVNEKGELQWASPSDARLLPGRLTEDRQWNTLLSTDKGGRDVAAVWLGGDAARQVMGLYMPLKVDNDPKPSRAVIARVIPQVILQTAIDERIRGNYDLEILDESQAVLPRPADTKRLHSDEQLARFANKYWQIRLWPTGARHSTPIMPLHRWIMLGGIIASCLITLAFVQVMRYRARDLKQSDRYLAALESLNEISTAISGKLGSGREIMERLAEAARSLLGMRRSIFTLLDSKEYCMRTYASSGDVRPDAPQVFPLEQLPVLRRCLNSGDVLFAEDTTKMTEPGIEDVIRAHDSKALILIPLRVEQRSIGLMALCDSKPRKFTDTERRLAQLLGSQASVILANNQLYEQTREGLELQKELHEQSGKDAQAKAILLRELHHRVKNNLAGIVGLLSMHEPDLPPSARQWLGRVTERIQTMARAHDLFSGGIERVNLSQLVQQVLPSLSVLTPPGVAVKVNAGELDMTFDTPRAVSLAMVLHELCTNALLHGLGGSGTLTISAQRTETSAVIEVSDEGGQVEGAQDWIEEIQGGDGDGSEGPWSAAATATAVRPRTGLYLVRELVRRELKGTLRLRRRAGGGTIASIELPLDAQDT